MVLTEAALLLDGCEDYSAPTVVHVVRGETVTTTHV